MPGENTSPYLATTSEVRKLAAFVDHPLHVTAYHPRELYAAGDYPSQSKPADGLPKFTSNDEEIANQDIVIWYTMGITHLPRAEDFPVMPTTSASFRLIPTGFFERNPSLDVPK